MNDEPMIALIILDFVPNLAFLLGVTWLVRFARREGGRQCALIMALGGALVFLGGTLKAIWKLLLGMGIGDMALLSEQQFVLLAPGFTLMLISTIILVRRGRPLPAAAVIGMAAWKVPLMAVMTLSSLGAQGILSSIGFRRRQPLAGVLFIVSAALVLLMAGMARGEQTAARQWMEEGVNSLAQIAFAAASYLLSRLASPT